MADQQVNSSTGSIEEDIRRANESTGSIEEYIRRANESTGSTETKERTSTSTRVNPYTSTSARQKLKEAVDFGGELSKAQILEDKNKVEIIRNYMMARHGSKYDSTRAIAIPDTKLVNDFVQHMRYFTANVASTAGESYWAFNTATEDQKQMAGEAYQLFDKLGNVFTTGTAGEKITGVKDYIFASAKDPTNYLGLATGGLSKFFTFGASQSGKTAVKRAMIQAGKDALLKKKSKNAVVKAMNTAKTKTAETLTKQFAKSKAGKELIKEAGENAAKFETKKIQATATNNFRRSLLNSAARKSLLATGAIDGIIAVGQDAQYQSTYIETGAQADFNEFQSAASFALGIVAAGGQYTFQKAGQKSRSKVDTKLKTKIRKSARLLNTPLLSLNWRNAKTADEAVNKNINDSVDAWAKKAKAGNYKDGPMLKTELLMEIVLGGDKKGGLVELYRKNSGGTRLAADVQFSDLMSLMTQYLSPANVKKIAKKINAVDPYIKLEDMTNAKALKTTLGDIIKDNASMAGRTLNVHSQGRKALDAAITASEMAMAAQIRALDPDGVIDFIPLMEYKKGQRVIHNNEIYTVKKDHKSKKAFELSNFEIDRNPKPISYGVNLWRRLLVSLPQTTALNLKGFASIYTGNGLAELLSATQYSAAAMLTSGAKRQEMLRMRNIYFQTQSKKFQSFFNPSDTFETFEAVLENNRDARKVLTEAYYMGVEKAGPRFGMDPEGTAIRTLETTANVANAVSGVRLQDLFTKSQFFIPELDKFLKMKHNKSLDEIIDSGEYSLIDGESIAFAVDGTQKAVFSKDYRNMKGGGAADLLSGVAQFVEFTSKIAPFNFILPFGRFLNNVVATAHQYGPTGLIESGVVEAVRKAKQAGGGKVAPRSILEKANAQSDFNKALVGTGALVGVTQYQFNKSEELGTFEVDGPGGTIIDHEFNFPFSLLLAGGEYIKSRIVNSPDYDAEQKEWNFENAAAKGRDLIIGNPSPEAKDNLFKQIGVGQFMTNSQFGNDLNSILDLLSAGVRTGREKDQADKFIQTGALLFAGATRPFGMANDLTGMIMGYDTAKDPRQTMGGREVFTESATRYTGHILRAVNEKLGEVLYGEDKAKKITEAITSKDFVSALRGGRIASSGNPFSKVLGVRYDEGKTNTEALVAVLGTNDYQLNQRTNQPALDETFNRIIQPILDRQARLLLSSKTFMEAPELRKRQIFEGLLKTMKEDTRRIVDDLGSVDDGTFRSLKAKEFNNGKYTKAVKTEALQYMEKNGKPTQIRDMSAGDLEILLFYAEQINFDVNQYVETFKAGRLIK